MYVTLAAPSLVIAEDEKLQTAEEVWRCPVSSKSISHHDLPQTALRCYQLITSSVGFWHPITVWLPGWRGVRSDGHTPLCHYHHGGDRGHHHVPVVCGGAVTLVLTKFRKCPGTGGLAGASGLIYYIGGWGSQWGHCSLLTPILAMCDRWHCRAAWSPPLHSCQDRLHSGDSDQTDHIKFGFYPFKSYVVVCENQQPDLDMVEGNVQGRVHEL